MGLVSLPEYTEDNPMYYRKTMQQCPSYYQFFDGEHEAKEIINEVLDNAEYSGLSHYDAYLLGSAIGYLLRCTRKGDFEGDIKKAKHFLSMIEDIK